jgi:hypothetical protein
MSQQKSILPIERIQQRIFLVRRQRVMLSTDLALLYGIPTKALTQAVRRNAERFPDDFVLVLSAEEVAVLRSQIVTSSAVHGGHRYPLMAFTEQGVAMLSSVLKLVTPPEPSPKKIGFGVRERGVRYETRRPRRKP